MKAYDVQHIPLDQIDKNPLNPQGRGDEGDIKGLLHSITESGLYYPILVNKKADDRYLIIEGHRRYAVYDTKRASNPDFASIPALVIAVGDQYITKIFREINETSKKLTGKQWLEVSALGGKTEDLPSRLSPAIKALRELFNPKELRDIAQRQGPSVHGLARRIATFCGYDSGDAAQLRTVIAWLVNSGDSVNARVAMQENHVERIQKAIQAGVRMNGAEYPDGEKIPPAAAVGPRKAA